MLIYLSLSVIITLLGLFLVREGQRKKKIWFLVITCLLFTLLASLRSFTVGTDTSNYAAFYTEIARVKGDRLFAYARQEAIEPGYVVYNWLLSRITTEPRFLLVVNAVIINAVFFFFIGRNSSNVLVSVYLYLFFLVFFETLNTMRETLALCFLLPGFELLKRRRWWGTLLFLLFFVLAVSFHHSALFGIFLVPMVAFNFSLLTFLLSLIILAVFYLEAVPIYNFLSSHLGSKPFEGPLWLNSGPPVHALVAFVILVFFLVTLYLNGERRSLWRSFLHTRYRREYDPTSFHLFIAFSYFMFNLIAMKHRIYYRIADLSQPFLLIGIPYFLKMFPRRRRRSYSVLVVSIFLLFFVSTWIIAPGYEDVWHYVFL